MTKRPLSITIISWLFIAVGSIGLLDSIVSLFHLTAAQLPARPLDTLDHARLSIGRDTGGRVHALYGRNLGKMAAGCLVGIPRPLSVCCTRR